MTTYDDPGAGHGFDDTAVDALDLTPRTGPAAGEDPAARVPRPPRRSGRLAWVALAVVLAGVGFVVFQGLGNATLYFRNADEAVAQIDDLGERRFRLQGLVVEDATQVDGFTEFTIAYNDVRIDVQATTAPPQLFALGIPVVLEGRFADGATADDPRFVADEILVKHDETYDAENPERVTDAEDGRTDDR